MCCIMPKQNAQPYDYMASSSAYNNSVSKVRS